MATQKVVQLQIQLKDAKSISDLNAVIKDINKELIQVDKNSEAFTELSKVSQDATGQLKSVKKELAGISSQQQKDSLLKVGGAIAAGFSIATVAVSAFGKQAEENVMKAIQVATSLSVAVQSIQPIVNALSSSNVKAFGLWIEGFKKSALGATLFGNSLRTALTVSGIGLLVVALGTIAVYWDDITAAINKTNKASEEYYATSLKNIELQKAGLISINDTLDVQNKILAIQGGKEKEIFENRRKSLVLQLSIAQDELKLAGDRINNYILENKLTAENLKLKAQVAKITGIDDPQIDKLLELKKGYDESNKSLIALKNSLAVLSAEEAKFDADEFEKTQKYKTKIYDEELKQRKKLDAQAVTDINNFEKDQVAKAQLTADQITKIHSDVQLKKVLSSRETADAIARIDREKIYVDEQIYKEQRDRLIQWYKDQEDLTEQEEDVLNELRLEKFNEFVDQYSPIVEEVINGIGQIGSAIADGIQRQIDNVKLQIEVVDAQYEQSIETRKYYEAQLADTQGTAHDQLLLDIEEERKKEIQLASEKKKLQNEAIKAQNKLNESNYRIQLVTAIANTALGVTKALGSFSPPVNFIMAALTGVIGGLEIAAISSNKPEPIPLIKAKGGFLEGFTGKGGKRDSTGEKSINNGVPVILHENEYVVPRRMVESSEYGGIIQQLELARTGKPMAVGGFTSEATPSISPSIEQLNSINAEYMKNAIENIKVYTVATEVRDKINTVDVIQNRSAA